VLNGALWHCAGSFAPGERFRAFFFRRQFVTDLERSHSEAVLMEATEENQEQRLGSGDGSRGLRGIDALGAAVSH
jgi:hypothetical protein